MEAQIKKIDGIYPVTVADAVYIGNGTANKLLPFLESKIDKIKPKEPTYLPYNFSPLIDCITANTATTKEAKVIGSPLGTLQYVGGICVNKKVYCAPNTADDVLVYDTVADATYHIGKGLGTNAFKYTGFVYWDGYIYAVPRGVNNFLRIDPVTDDVKIIPMDFVYSVSPYGDYRDSHHYNGVISDDGYLYSPPAYASNKLLKVNMNTFDFKELEFGSSDTNTWTGCVKHPFEDKIIFFGGKVLRIYNCGDDSWTDLTSDTDRGCYDMVYDPITNTMIGIYSHKLFALNLDDYTFTDSNYINYMEKGYGVTIGLDGNIYHLEGNSAYVFKFDGTAFTQLDTVIAAESAGSETPTLAGMALCNSGDIIGIPASGAMVRLKFNNVVKPLPDYIVTSAYYGKY